MTNLSYTQKLKEIVESSSMHGIPNVIRTKSTVIRIFWILIILSFFSYSTYSVVLIIIKYFQYNVIVRMKIVESYNSEFPAVTFCNINPFDFTIEENFKMVSLLLNESFLYRNDLKSKICNSQMTGMLNNALPNLKGFTLEKLLVSCQFDEKPCDPNNFFPQRTFYYRNCYSFNYGKNSTGQSIPIQNAKRTGIINGLTLKLFIGAPEYQPCWEHRFGALIVVHNQTSPPVFAQEGLFVQPGAETNFVLNKVTINKMVSPYSNCVANISNRNELDSVWYRNAFDFSGRYTQKWCILNCSVSKVMEENIPICEALDLASSLERALCLNNLQNVTNFYGLCSHECPIECDYSYFNIFTSASSFPSYSYANFLLSNKSFMSKFPYGNVTMEQLRDSVVSLNVYFDSSSFQKIEELPESDFGSLLGNLGGQLGLFLGVSFLTFAELFEILFQFLFIFFQNHKKLDFKNNCKTKVEILEKPL
ncbi:acid-sensing ion channel 1-like [Brachionus plicatilis]|uniref:Acid-sensing ion channel 1-like n=1 Tax=Brachionus plicatilis TaxID=10195 RepID=A0A3M7SSL5_BRAPC|nr:acid-sensing ion channel 1-like [Brachionus plicatilis]